MNRLSFRVPFELKTAKRTDVAHRAQVMLYSLLMADRYGDSQACAQRSQLTHSNTTLASSLSGANSTSSHSVHPSLGEEGLLAALQRTCAASLLYYVTMNQLDPVPVSWTELRALIIRRNTLARYLHVPSSSRHQSGHPPVELPRAQQLDSDDVTSADPALPPLLQVHGVLPCVYKLCTEVAESAVPQCHL